MYNLEIKKEYIDTIDNEGSALVIEAALKRAEPTERMLNKDIYEMSAEELKMVIRDISPYSQTGVKNYLAYYRSYIDWATKRGYAKSNINLISLFTQKDLKELSSNVKRSNWTRDEVMELISSLVNQTDRALILALFEGIDGLRFSELGYLKEEDLDFDGIQYAATLTSDTSSGKIKKRKIEISKELFMMLILANKQTRYLANNGQSTAKNKEIEFMDSPYIFKLTKRTKSTRKIAINNRVIGNKFHLFRNIFAFDNFRPRDLIRSGMLYKAHEIYQQKGVFSKNEILAIGEHFDTPLIRAEGYEPYRNITVIKKILKSSDFEEKYGYKLPID